MKDPLLLSYTVEELQIEYFMEWIETDPMQAYAHGGEGVQFRTGDAVVDEWEAQIAQGETPDFEKHVDPEFLERFKRFSKATAQAAHPWLATKESSEEEATVEEEEDLDPDGGFGDSYED
jgi:hypothetical protein